MTWLIMLLGLAGIILNIRRNRFCFVIWIPVNLALAAEAFRAHNPALGIMFCAYAASSAWGLWTWRPDPVAKQLDRAMQEAVEALEAIRGRKR